jgi:putative ABC transport system substrate-binding protein
MPMIRYLNPNSSGPNAPNMAAFRQGLNDGGYVEGQNVVIEYRWAEGATIGYLPWPPNSSPPKST